MPKAKERGFALGDALPRKQNLTFPNDTVIGFGRQSSITSSFLLTQINPEFQSLIVLAERAASPLLFDLMRLKLEMNRLLLGIGTAGGKGE